MVLMGILARHKVVVYSQVRVGPYMDFCKECSLMPSGVDGVASSVFLVGKAWFLAETRGTLILISMCHP